jgi:hypothetical protein
MTGMAIEHSSTITPSSPTAESSVTRGSITVISPTLASAVAASFAAADFTDLRVFVASQECAPVGSVALITAETSEAFPLAADRALEVEASTEVVSMAVVDGTK